MKDISRNVPLLCSVCGNDQFSFDNEDEKTTYKCSNCGAEFEKDVLLAENQNVINANIEDIKKEAVKELKKNFKSLR